MNVLVEGWTEAVGLLETLLVELERRMTGLVLMLGVMWLMVSVLSETKICGVFRLSDSDISEALTEADKLSAPLFTASAAFLK